MVPDHILAPWHPTPWSVPWSVARPTTASGCLSASCPTTSSVSLSAFITGLPLGLQRASTDFPLGSRGPLPSPPNSREGFCPSPVPQVAPRTPWLFSVWSSCFLLYSWFSCNFIYLLFLYFSLSYLCLPFVSLSCLAPVCFCVWVCTFSSLSVTHRHLFLFLEGRGECKFLMWYQKQIHFNYFQCVLDECSINTGTYLVNAKIGV